MGCYSREVGVGRHDFLLAGLLLILDVDGELYTQYSVGRHDFLLAGLLRLYGR